MKFVKQNALYIAWVQSLVATLGSLYFSEVAHFAPCVLCWYQRIGMYPLVLLLTVGIVRKDKNVVWYALPVAIAGFLVSVYHNLMYYGFISEAMAPCTIGASCNAKYINWLGFITIPLLSLTAFVVIITCLVLAIRSHSATSQKKTEE